MANATVGALITKTEEGVTRILLTKRNVDPFRDYWCLPGGHIDPYESAVSAIVREVYEETGLEFNPRFLTYLDEIFQEKQVHNLVIIFYGEATGILKANPEEVSGIGWFSPEQAVQMDLAFCHRQAVEIFMAEVPDL
jgi:8-oxo-dGTP diphosphatase